MSPEQFSNQLAKMRLRVDRFIHDDAPVIAAKLAVRKFKENFQNEGFFGDKWSEVNRRKNPKTKGADRTRPILTGRTGNLGASIRMEVAAGSAVVYSDLPYSAAHNDGTNNAGRSRSTTIPKRQFLGDHPDLDRQTKQQLQAKLNSALTSLKA